MRLSFMIVLAGCSDVCSFALQAPQKQQHRRQQQSHPPRTEAMSLTTTTSYAQWCPSMDGSSKYPPSDSMLLQANKVAVVVDSLATMAASFIFFAMNLFQISSVPALVAAKPAKDERVPRHLSNYALRKIILRDCRERNSLVTADFTPSIFHKSCRFKDGSGLDGSYPIKPWILGCKILFNEKQSKGRVDEGSLVVTSYGVTFRFESVLEFRGPFSPRVYLSGRIIMTRDPKTLLISSYQEIWDRDLLEILKSAELQLWQG